MPEFKWVRAYTGPRDVQTRFRVIYWTEKEGFRTEHHEQQYDALRALPADAPREAVETILRGKTWTRLSCRHCNKDAPMVARIRPDGLLMDICQGCIRGFAAAAPIMRPCMVMQAGDRTWCAVCALQWDTNEEQPPPCPAGPAP